MTGLLSIFSISLMIGLVLTIGIIKIVNHPITPVHATQVAKSNDQTEMVAKEKIANQQDNSVKKQQTQKHRFLLKQTANTRLSPKGKALFSL
jgi:hypothetical protein